MANHPLATQVYEASIPTVDNSQGSVRRTPRDMKNVVQEAASEAFSRETFRTIDRVTLSSDTWAPKSETTDSQLTIPVFIPPAAGGTSCAQGREPIHSHLKTRRDC